MKVAIAQFLDIEEALDAERRLIKSRWEQYRLTGETINHAQVKAWAASLDSAKADAN